VRTAHRPDNDRRRLKKEAIVRKRKTNTTSFASAAGVESGKIMHNPIEVNESLIGVSNEERHQLIAEAAYFRSEHRRFEPGHELEDWLMAESEIKTKLLNREV
jgi:hypothetical protein